MKIGNIDVKWQTIVYAILAVAGQIFGLTDHATSVADHVTTIGETFGIASVLKEIVAHWVENK